MAAINARTLLYPIVALVLVVALIQLRPGRTGPPPGDGPASTEARTDEDATTRPFAMLRGAPLPLPPQLQVDADPAERWFRRMLWAPSNLVVYTQRRVASLDDVQRRRFVELVDQLWSRSPEQTHVFFTSLGELVDTVPRALEILIEATRSSSNLVRDWATRGLMVAEGPDAARQVEKLLYDTSQQVRRAATQALIEMRDPEALAALQRYAETDPEEGIRHVLHNLGRHTDDPSSIPILRRYIDTDPVLDQLAIAALARFGDPNAIDILFRRLELPDAEIQVRALTNLRGAPTDQLDPRRLLPFLSATSPMTRLNATELLLAMARDDLITVADDPDIAAALLEQSNDRDYQVSQIATAALYALGRKDVAEAYLKGIETSTGAVLHNNVDMAATLLGDERTLDAVRRRLDRATPPNDLRDQIILIAGLGQLRDPAASDILIGYVRGASAVEEVDENGSSLSSKAAHVLPNLGASVIPELLEVAHDAEASLHARVRALDALRGFAELDVVDELVAIAVEPENDVALRRAALETLPFVRDADIFQALAEALPDLEVFELAQTARVVMADYS